MSAVTFVNVSFHCDENAWVAELARKHLASVEISRNDDPADRGLACCFLEDIGHRSGSNPGTEGGLLTWSTSRNQPDVGAFAKNLYQFWYELLATNSDSGPFYTERIVVLFENEHTNHAECFEIGFSAEAASTLTELYMEIRLNPEAAMESGATLEIKNYQLPFSWMTS